MSGPADAQKTQDAINKVAEQADAALALAVALVSGLAKIGKLSAEEAGAIATDALSTIPPTSRRRLQDVMVRALPGYSPPRFSAFGAGRAVDLDQLEEARSKRASEAQ